MTAIVQKIYYYYYYYYYSIIFCTLHLFVVCAKDRNIITVLVTVVGVVAPAIGQSHCSVSQTMEEHQTTILGNTTTEEEPSVEPSLVVGTQHQQQQQEEKKIIMDTDDGKEKKIADGEQRKETKLADEAIPASNDATNTIPTTTTTNANANANATTSGEYRSWDFANRKVMIKNILKYDDKRTMKKMTQAWMAATGNKVNIVKCKKPPREPWALLTMEKEEHVPILIDYINANNITTKKGDKLFAHAVEKNHGVQDDYGDDNDDDDDDDNSNHDGRDDGGGGGGGGGGGHKRSSNDITKKDERTHNKRQRVQKAVMNAKPRVITPEEVKDAIIPLWKNTYEEQLKAKEKDMIKNSVLKIVKEVKARFRYVFCVCCYCLPVLFDIDLLRVCICHQQLILIF